MRRDLGTPYDEKTTEKAEEVVETGREAAASAIPRGLEHVNVAISGPYEDTKEMAEESWFGVGDGEGQPRRCDSCGAGKGGERRLGSSVLWLGACHSEAISRLLMRRPRRGRWRRGKGERWFMRRGWISPSALLGTTVLFCPVFLGQLQFP